MKKLSKLLIFISFICIVCGCSSNSKTVTISMDAEEDSGYKWVYSVNKKNIIKEKNSSVEVLESSNTEGLINSVYHFTFSGNNDGEVLVTFEYINSTDNDTKYKIIYKLKVVDEKIIVEESSGNFPSQVS